MSTIVPSFVGFISGVLSQSEPLSDDISARFVIEFVATGFIVKVIETFAWEPGAMLGITLCAIIPVFTQFISFRVSHAGI